MNSSNAATVVPIVGAWQESALARRRRSSADDARAQPIVNLGLVGGVASAFGNRVGQHNAAGLTIDLGALGAEGFAQIPPRVDVTI